MVVIFMEDDWVLNGFKLVGLKRVSDYGLYIKVFVHHI